VVPPGVVPRHEPGDLGLQFRRRLPHQEVHPRLAGPVIPLDLAVGLGMVRRSQDAATSLTEAERLGETRLAIKALTTGGAPSSFMAGRLVPGFHLDNLWNQVALYACSHRGTISYGMAGSAPRGMRRRLAGGD